MKVPYSQLKDQLKTGDLVLFSGQYKMSQEVEKLGLLKGKKPINGYMPKDFSTDGHLSLQNVSLSEEILIALS